MAQTLQCDADTPLYLQGDRTDRVYYVASGSAVEQYEEGSIIFPVRVAAGEFGGVMELLAGAGTRLGRLTTAGPATVQIQTQEEFFAAVLADAALLDRTLRRSIGALRQLNSIAKQYMGSVEEHDAGENLFAMAAFFLGMKRPLQALYVFRRYAELYPDGLHAKTVHEQLAALQDEVESSGLGLTPDEMLTKATALEQRGDFAAAAELYKKALVKKPEAGAVPGIVLRQANALQMAGKPLLGIKALKTLPPDDLAADDRAQALFLEGRCYELMQDPKKACLLYTQCDSGIWQQLAQARLLELGHGHG
jgi:tetratricopeptide (TPR) repeat protein